MTGPVRTVVHLLRHGEVANPTGVLYGQLAGFRLSPLGEQMALAVVTALAGHDLIYLASSPLERAVQTAEPFAAKFNLDMISDERLIESTNWFEGKRLGVGDGALRDPRNWWRLRNPFTPSWGEHYAVIARRMLAAVLDARAAAAGHEALCVSHQLPIWTVRRFLERRRLWHDPRRRQCALASLTSLHFDGDRLVQIEYQEPAAHLATSANRSVRGA
jgi:broad specificity phosphatase PhoE